MESSPAGGIRILVCLAAIFVFVLRPWNYLIVIVGALAEGIYIWNRTKEGRKKEEHIENRDAIENYAGREIMFFEELKEKQVQHSDL